MSDYPDTPPEKQREIVLRMFKHRLARLQRLVDLEAPDIILIMETQLLAKAGEMLNPHYWYRQLAHESQIKARRATGICVVPTCEAEVKGGDEGPFDVDHCAAHAAEMEKEVLEDDNLDDEEEELS